MTDSATRAALDTPELTGDHVRLRAARNSDVPRIVEACADPVTQEWLGSLPAPYTEDDARRWLRETREGAEQGRKVTWVAVDPDTDEVIGSVDLFDVEVGDRAEVGYWSHPSARGKGRTTEACRLAVAHGFDELGLRTVTAHAATENQASQKVLEAIGFRRVEVVTEGTTVRSGPADAILFSRTTTPDPTAGLHADDIEVHQNKSVLLPRTTLSLAEGEIVVAVGRPGSGHTALALAVAGRLPLASGQVTLDGSQEPSVLQRAVALVDVPGVTEPDGAIPLRTIVGEELAMARRKASRHAVASWLADDGLADHADAVMDDVPADLRVGALARLAALRPGVRFLVLTYPERHGLPPGAWLDLARGLAEDGYGVLATASEAADLPADFRRRPIGPEELTR